MKKTVLALGLSAALLAGFANAHQAGDVVVRGGAILVDTHTRTDSDVFKFKVNNNTQLGLTGTYMFTDNIGVELLAATPFSHEIKLGSNLVGKTKHLPPSLYAQYYLFDKDAKVRPYVGAGINYTTFFSEKAKLDGVSNLKLKDSFGLIVNAGMDIKLAENLYLNAAVWYAKIKSKASFDLSGQHHTVSVKLDPTIYFVGLGYRF
ncbi:OmpW family outer membrane protein [uncultured Haemophilus sp.]|uniref:OmpW family outer membrane protein n=1 Tax=uncultured Haemophilus sp. TaxID=237779 RepID=UPI0028048B1D|nr:OmpW family outer membrane protein [uncultured Haemophilus sp.]